MELRNLTNAFVDIKLNNGTRIFIDPWMTQGIYEGSWHHVDEVKLQSVDDVKYVFITHIHADHFDTKFIDSLPQTTKIYFPDIYPNRAVVGRKLPNRECIFVSVDETISVEEVFSFRFFSPMNGFGHLSEKFDDSEPNLAIDTGVAIFGDDARIIMLADNFPFKYNEEQISWMKKCDLLMFPYNAAADDYPICYDNLTALEKKSILYRRNFDRAARMDAFIKRVEPKLATPYSSDFLVAGPRAEEFIDLQPSMFLDREKCATFFSTMTGFPVVFLNKNDRIEFISGQSFIYHSESVDALNVHERAKTLLNKSNVKDLYADVDDPTLTSAFLQAANGMLSKMREKKYHSDRVLVLRASDSEWSGSIDLESCEVSSPARFFEGSDFVECKAEKCYLHALLTFKAHWDNAIISYNLSWKRVPDEYDYYLYKGLNFFHVPLKKS